MTFLLSLVMFAPSSFLARRFNLPYRLAVVLCYALIIVIMGVALARFIPASADAASTLRDTAEQRFQQDRPAPSWGPVLDPVPPPRGPQAPGIAP